MAHHRAPASAAQPSSGTSLQPRHPHAHQRPGHHQRKHHVAKHPAHYQAQRYHHKNQPQRQGNGSALGRLPAQLPQPNGDVDDGGHRNPAQIQRERHAQPAPGPLRQKCAAGPGRTATIRQPRIEQHYAHAGQNHLVGKQHHPGPGGHVGQRQRLGHGIGQRHARVAPAAAATPHKRPGPEKSAPRCRRHSPPA